MGLHTEVVAASVVVDSEGRVLMVRESKASALGRWSLPAGRVERGESLSDAARREAKEETGYDVEVGSLIGIHHAPATLEGGSAVVFVYRAIVVDGAATVSEAHPEVAWLNRARLAELIEERMVRGQHVGPALAAYDAGTSLPDDLVKTVLPSMPPRASG